MTRLVPFEDLPQWVPGRVLLASDGLGWQGVGLRAYHYQGQDVIVPAMRDFLLVGYRLGATAMQRRFDGRWSRDQLSPGAASLLTRAQQAHWTWVDPIDVIHVYLNEELVRAVAGEVLDCHVAGVTLADVLRTDDPKMSLWMQAIAEEARQQALGGPLYVESLARGLIVHLLRRYAAVDMPRPVQATRLSPQQEHRISEYVEARLGEPIDLAGMAAEVGLTPCLFARLFRGSFGRPPYAFVLCRRLDRAERMLRTGTEPIKVIAADCGFSDQAHLTRLFKRTHGTTPAAYRKTVGNAAQS